MNTIRELFRNHSFGIALLATILFLVVVAGLAFGALCLEGWVLMLLWNAVIPTLWASAPSLSLWLAVGLILICSILFKNIPRSKE